MEHEMKISPSAVRRLRTDRGWSQDQLAMASGLSLRTIQRVEAEGIASVGTAVSLAATYGTKLIELQEEQSDSAGRSIWLWPSALLLGLAIVTLVLLGDSGRLAGLPVSQGLAAVNISVAFLGAVLVLLAVARLFRQRQYVAVGLAVLGMPLVSFLGAAAIFSFVSGRTLSWDLFAFGALGVALLVMAAREFRGGTQRPGPNNSFKPKPLRGSA